LKSAFTNDDPHIRALALVCEWGKFRDPVCSKLADGFRDIDLDGGRVPLCRKHLEELDRLLKADAEQGEWLSRNFGGGSRIVVRRGEGGE
jgi:hypothetical protein